MIELIYHKGRMKLPESFDELSGKQFIGISNLLFTGGEKLKCQVKALKILCGLPSLKFVLLKAAVIDRAIEYVDWVFDEKKVISKQLITVYRGYRGPTSEFDNLRMKEFHMSERFYKEIVNGENEDIEASLNNLVAVLYRPGKLFYNKKKDKDGDIRIDFNHNKLPYYSKKVARWPMKVKQAIFLWYGGCRQQLEDNNPLVFKSPSGDFESQFDTGMYGVMRNLAGDKLGTVEKIEEMYVVEAMVEIGLIKEEEEYFESKMKKPA
jgi:hypothetical protein